MLSTKPGVRLDEHTVGAARQFNWEAFDLRTTTQEVVDLIERPMAKFFLSHTKEELYKGGLQYRAIVYPVSTTEDLLQKGRICQASH